MNTWWFGKSWSRDLPPEDEVSVPAMEVCVDCGSLLKETDRGVVTRSSSRVWESFDLDISGSPVRVCVYHLSCWLGQVVGGVASAEVLSRIPSETERRELMGDGVEDTVETGGWGNDGQDPEGTAED